MEIRGGGEIHFVSRGPVPLKKKTQNPEGERFAPEWSKYLQVNHVGPTRLGFLKNRLTPGCGWDIDLLQGALLRTEDSLTYMPYAVPFMV